MISVKVIYNYV